MKRNRNTSWLLICLAFLFLAADDPEADRLGSDPPAKPDSQVFLISVPLPLTGGADLEVISTVDKLLAGIDTAATRPTLIFEFKVLDDQVQDLSQFERALALARYLASDRFSQVRTVAFVPGSIQGHAVLPMLACEEIIVAPDATVGGCGVHEPSIDETMLAAYREIAQRRRTIPVPIVLSMLDPRLSVTKVQFVSGGTRYVLADDLEKLRESGTIKGEKSVVPTGDLGIFTGRQLRLEFGFASRLASDRNELAAALKISPNLIHDNTVSPGNWIALRVEVRNRITSRVAGDVIRAMIDGQAEKGANLICLHINSAGGATGPALRLVDFLADLDPSEVRTVAFIEDKALSVAALIALACDETYANEAATIGGPGDTFLGRDDLLDSRESIEAAARRKGRDWSLRMGLVDRDLEVFRCRQKGTDAIRYFSEVERRQQQRPDEWQREEPLDLTKGMAAVQAKQTGLIQDTAESLDMVFNRLNIHDEVEVAERNQVVSAIERLATQTWFARTLLFIAFFALISEASAPGLGVAGFVSAICFLLFFWCQFLNGTADWLELVLFGGGLICIALEIFVIPGFGVFGIGGIVMVLGSIVLASQTFIIPRNAYQFGQLPNSLLTVAIACGGVLGSIWIMQRFLTTAPFLRRIMLPARPADDEMDRKEAIVDWYYLEGKRGVTTTQLTPSGKARFGDDVISVISDGILVPKDTSVYVSEVQGNRVVVEPVEEG